MFSTDVVETWRIIISKMQFAVAGLAPFVYTPPLWKCWSWTLPFFYQSNYYKEKNSVEITIIKFFQGMLVRKRVKLRQKTFTQRRKQERWKQWKVSPSVKKKLVNLESALFPCLEEEDEPSRFVTFDSIRRKQGGRLQERKRD